MRFNVLMGLLGAVLVAYIALPIAGIILRVNPQQLAEAFTSPRLLSSLLLSLETATFSTSVMAFVGIPLGYLISRSDSRLAEALRIGSTIPLVIPPLIAGALLLNVYGANSPIGSFALSTGLQLSQTPLGIILAQVFVASPFVVLTASAAFERVDRYYEFVSRILGRSQAFTFIRVTLPLAWRGIAAGLVLAWVRAVGELGATVMMAYNPKTISIQLWEENAIGGLSFVLPGVVIVILVSFLLLLVWIWLSSLERRRSWLGVGSG